MIDKKQIIEDCKILLKAYKEWKLGFMKMPEDENPWFNSEEKELQLIYFTLPMSLNYQRNSYTLWESVLKSFNHDQTRALFDIKFSASCEEEELRLLLTKHKIALQPNKHIKTWQTISKTIHENWWSIEELLIYANYDFLKLKKTLQVEHKKGFPYLSWPKIFNYWSYILWEYCWINLKNREYIEIAPDTHVKQCSIRLWVISSEQANGVSTEEISEIWREVLEWSWINPIDMHSPLWFWSRNNFQFKLK